MTTPDNPDSPASARMPRRIQFEYHKCPKCGYSTVAERPDLETCPIPWDDDGVSRPDAPCCGGDIGEGGALVPWWMIPDDIQAEIMRRQEVAP